MCLSLTGAIAKVSPKPCRTSKLLSITVPRTTPRPGANTPYGQHSYVPPFIPDQRQINLLITDPLHPLSEYVSTNVAHSCLQSRAAHDDLHILQV